MSNIKPSYFVPRDLYPPDTLIKLGQLILRLDDPGNILDEEGPLDLEKYKINVHTMPYSVVQNVSESGTTSHVESRLFFKALQFLTGKLKMLFDRSAFDSVLSRIDRLDTQVFVPSDAYVEASLTTPNVQKRLRRYLFRPSVYMVTGVKIAKKGAQISAQRDDIRETAFQGEAAGGTEQASGGGAVQVQKKTYHFNGTSFVVDGDFVYAFQVRECSYGCRIGVKKDLYAKKAVLAEGPIVKHPSVGGVAENMEEPGENLEFEFYGVGDRDVTVDDLGRDKGQYDTVALEDEGTEEAWSCAILKEA